MSSSGVGRRMSAVDDQGAGFALSPTAAASEAALIAALCAGSDRAFREVVDRHNASMVRVAALFVRGHAAAEDVVQDVWLIVARQIGTFEARCSLKTWIFRILTNRAKTAGQRQARDVPMSAVAEIEWQAWEPSEAPEERILLEDTIDVVLEAIRELPPPQRQVISLRDIDGCTAEEVCARLDLNDGNQRVILHRARTKVRERLRTYHDEAERDDAA